jgi:hypothetical protein
MSASAVQALVGARTIGGILVADRPAITPAFEASGAVVPAVHAPLVVVFHLGALRRQTDIIVDAAENVRAEQPVFRRALERDQKLTRALRRTHERRVGVREAPRHVVPLPARQCRHRCAQRCRDAPGRVGQRARGRVLDVPVGSIQHRAVGDMRDVRVAGVCLTGEAARARASASPSAASRTPSRTTTSRSRAGATPSAASPARPRSIGSRPILDRRTAARDSQQPDHQSPPHYPGRRIAASPCASFPRGRRSAERK